MPLTQPLRLILASLLLGFCLTVQAEVKLPNGEYVETTTDLSVKVLGGAISINRTWANGRWYINPAWATLKFTYDNLDASVKTIDKAGALYEKTGSGVYVYDRRFFIKAEPTGWRWYDRQGNWITYNANGQILSYGNKNNIKVSFDLDPQGRPIQIRDHFAEIMLSFTYTGEYLTRVTDKVGRQVNYVYTGANLTSVTDVLGHATTYSYDGNGQLLTKTDANGGILTLTYSQSYKVNTAITKALAQSGGVATTAGSTRDWRISRVATLTDPMGGVTRYTYDYDRVARSYTILQTSPAGIKTERVYDSEGKLRREEVGTRLTHQLQKDGTHIETSVNERGLATRTEYDANRNPIKVTHADGTSITASYDPVYSNPLNSTDEAGIKTQYEYDATGNLLKLSEAVGLPEARVTTYTYDQYGQRASYTRGAVTYRYSYDNYGNLKEVTDPLTNKTRFTHDVMGNALSRIDPLGNTYQASFNLKGDKTTDTTPLGFITTYSFDKLGNRMQLTDANNATTQFSYDKNNRLTAVTDPLLAKTSFTYDADGRRLIVTDPEGVILKYQYDVTGRLIKTIDGNGNAITTVYGDATNALEGLIAKVIYPSYTEEYKYDNRNRIIQTSQILDANTRITTSSLYDGVGNLVSQTDAKGQTRQSSFDGLRRLIKTLDPQANATQYQYDALDNLLALTDAKGNTTRYSYDLLNRKTMEVKPQGETTQYQYDANGRLTTITNAKGQKRVYSLDADGRTTQEMRFAANSTTPTTTIRYRYTTTNLLSGYTQGSLNADYAFDAKGQKLSETINFGSFSKSHAYSYYLNGHKKTMTYPNNTLVSYTYDTNNQLKRIALPLGAINIDSYSWTQPTQISYPGLTKTLNYDPVQRLTQITLQTNPGNATVMDYRYQYDAASNIIQKTTESGATLYQYDPLDRLTQANPPTTLGLPQEHYQYDALGNRITSLHQPGTFSYNANNQLTLAPQTQYHYDLSGHTTKEIKGPNTRDFIYDEAERLIEVKDNNLSLGQYQYDPLGRRIQKTTPQGAIYFHYSDEGLIAEYDATGTPLSFYGWQPNGTWGTNPQFTLQNNQTYYYHNDHLGTPQKLTDSLGKVVWQAKSEAFGKTVVDPASTIHNPLRFAGQYEDQETGLHYNLYRDYSPNVGRYVQADPWGLKAGINPYNYVKANPLKQTDPFGLFTVIIPIEFIQTGKDKGSGCGDASTDTKIPDAYLGWSFAEPCSNHDRCYGTCGEQKAKCDDDFFKDMEVKCNNMSPGLKMVLYKSCMLTADAYYIAVALKGQDAYCTAQKQACPECTKIPGCL